MNPLVIYILLCVQNVNICLFYNERFGPEPGVHRRLFHLSQIEYNNMAQTVFSTEAQEPVH